MKLEYHAPGIFENVSEAEYHADPSLGSSSLKNLLVSPLTYWTNSVHNPDREPEEEKDSTGYGTALHVRLLQGREAFEARYAPLLTPDKHPDALKSGDDLAARCKALGLKQSGTIQERTDRIRTEDPDAELWLDIRARYVAEIGGRKEIPEKWIRNIELAAKAVDGESYLKDGQSEVSLFWRVPFELAGKVIEVPLKARLDHRKDAEITDVKSFAGRRNRPLDKAVAFALEEERYDIQAASYLDGLKTLTGKASTFTLLFVQSGPAPNVLVRKFEERVFNEAQVIWNNSRRDMEFAVGRWVWCSQKFGFDQPWVEKAVPQSFRDEDFRLSFLD